MMIANEVDLVILVWMDSVLRRYRVFLFLNKYRYK